MSYRNLLVQIVCTVSVFVVSDSENYIESCLEHNESLLLRRNLNR